MFIDVIISREYLAEAFFGSMIHDETTNNKLLILFVLDKLEMAVSEEILLQICSMDNDWIPYLFCKQLIHELLRSGFITRVGNNNNPMIALTTDGRTCLAHFYNDIALSIQEEVAEYVRSHRLDYRKKQEFIADYYRNGDSTFTVSLKILQVSQPLLDIKMVVPTRSVAASIYNSWNEKAPEVYRALHDILVED